MTSSKRAMVYALIIGLVTIAVVLIVFYRELGGFEKVQYDDAYITYRYVYNLGHGQGLRFNPSDSTNSASSFLFAIALFFFSLGGRLSLPLVASVLNITSLVLLSASIAYIPLKLNPNLLGKLTAIGASFITASGGYVAYWMMSGMETIFVMSILGIYLALVATQTNDLLNGDMKSWRRVCFVGLLLSLSRLEAAMVVTVSTALFYALYLYKNWRRGKENLRVALYGATPGLGTGLLLLFYRLYYGHFLPDPMAFKELARYYRRTPKQSLQISSDFLLHDSAWLSKIAILLVVLALGKGIKDRKLNMSVLFSVVVLGLWLIALVNSPHSDEMRYQLPLLVALGVIVATSVSYILSSLTNRTALAAVMLLGTITVLATATSNYRQFKKIRMSTSWSWEIQQARIDLGKQISGKIPSGSRVWSGDLGALSFYDHKNIYIDGAALVNHQLLEVVRSSGDYAREIARQNPDYIADSVGESDGRPSVLSIFDAPQNYYEPVKTRTTSSCSSTDTISLTELLRSETPTAPIDVRLFQIRWKGCK